MNELGVNYCPTGCGRPVRTGQLTCLQCWRQIPKHLQREVWRTWTRWKADMGDADLMQEYEDARENALAAIG